MKNKMNDKYRLSSSESNELPWYLRYWFIWVGLGVATYQGMSYLNAPSVKRPVYNSKEDCLADWANTPRDCEEDRSGGNAYIRRWYGPWIDDRGTVYHDNGSRSMRAENTIHSSSFSSSTRLGFGASSRSGRGG